MKENNNLLRKKFRLAILASLIFNSHSYATNYVEEVNLDNTKIVGGDSVKIDKKDDVTPVIGIHNGSVGNNNKIILGVGENISVDVTSNASDATGLKLVSSYASTYPHELGKGTQVKVESGKNAVGIHLDLDADGMYQFPGRINANDIDIQAKGQQNATGLLIQNTINKKWGGDATLNGGSISALSDGTSTAIRVNGGELGLGATAGIINANNLNLIADGKLAYGLAFTGDAPGINLGDDSTILINDDKGISEGGSGILLDGDGIKNLTASDLSIIVNGDQRHGITVDEAYQNASNINLGKNSNILTTGNGGTAVLLNENASTSFLAKHINIVTQGESANLIEANNGFMMISDGSFLQSQKSGGVLASSINSSNPTIYIYDSTLNTYTFGALAQGKNASINFFGTFVGTEKESAIQAEDNSTISAIDSSIVSNYGVGIKALSGGHVDFSGGEIPTLVSSKLNNSLESSGENSLIKGRGAAIIFGNIRANDNAVIDLDLSDGSSIGAGNAQSSSGGIINISLKNNSIWNSIGSSIVNGLKLDHSALYIASTSEASFVGNTVTVNGNYEGQEGHIYFNTVLGDDKSITDKLLINGDSSGTTFVSVNNLGGKGAATTEGIELIHVTGQSEGTFTQSGRIVAGAYDYNLIRGDKTNGNNWYLSSNQTLPTAPIEPIDPSMPEVGPIITNPIEPIDPSMPEVGPIVTDPIEPIDPSMPEVGPIITDPIEPIDPSMPEVGPIVTDPIEPIDPSMPEVGPIITDPIEPIDPSMPEVGPIVTDPIEPIDPSIPEIEPEGPTPPPSSGKHINRPESGSYISNIAAANTLFNTRLHDRLGKTQYIDALTGEEKVTSLWLRQVGGHNNWRDSSGQLKTQSNSYVTQLGGEVVQWSSDGLNRGHLGLMTGYANSHSKTHSSVTGYDSKGSINGYSAGIYGTWFANDTDKSGVYIDSWLQYSWFNNHVNGEQLASESYKSKGLTASLETGYNLKIGESYGIQGTLNEWFIQPQAQATWMGVKADKHKEDNGTRVSSDGDGNIQTRLGIRAYMKSHHGMDEGKMRTFEPFIEANWLHNTRSYSAKMDDVRINQAGAGNLGEIKVGLEGQINPRVNVWGNIGAQVGDKGYNDSSAMIGVKYNF